MEPWFPGRDDLEARGDRQAGLFEKARGAALAHFGNRVFVRGVVEASNVCRENCAYCGMRRDNRSLDRYRSRLDQLAELLVDHRPASMTDVNIQTGEDPIAAREVVLPLVRILRSQTPLGVSVCLGTLPVELYDALQAAGASLYIIKFELASPDLYRDLEAPGTLDERTAAIRLLASRGWKVSSGFIAGLPGQSTADLLANFDLAASLPLAGCSVSPFVPGDETPLAASPAGDIETTLNCMAALRCMRPDWVIPAVSALNLAQPGAGYSRGLALGANLCTINLTPEAIRGDYLLYRRERFIMNETRILEAVDRARLRISDSSLASHLAQSPSPARPTPPRPGTDARSRPRSDALPAGTSA